jgi:hypothetical protein
MELTKPLAELAGDSRALILLLLLTFASLFLSPSHSESTIKGEIKE